MAASRRDEPSIGRAFPELPRRVRDLVRERRITWGELVRRTGLSRPTLHRLSRGEGNPALSSFLLLARSLGVSVADLLGPEEAAASAALPPGVLREPLLSDAPAGDPRALWIYRAVCRGTPPEEVHREIERTHFLLTAERPEAAVSRAILDVFHHQQAWIEHHLPRVKGLEARIQERFDLPVRPELEDRLSVRVIDLPRQFLPMVQIHALAAMAAAVVKEFLRTYRILGFADGFTVSTVQKFLRRGDLTKAELVPLSHTPRFAQFELSGATLIGAMALTHQGYQIRSTIELAQLQERIGAVQVAVTSCGSVKETGPFSRWARLMSEASPDQDYRTFFRMLESRGVVGDLLYHFLDADGGWHRKIPGAARDIEEADLRKLATHTEGDPQIYSVSPPGMARIARRGVCMLLVHSADRAALARAALLRKRERPVNFVITTRAAAEEILGSGGKRRA